MSRMIFVNLPVQDLAAATCCYEAIGCEKNEQWPYFRGAVYGHECSVRNDG